MADGEGLVLHPDKNPDKGPNENLNKIPNQVPNANLPPSQNALPLLNPFVPNAPIMTKAPQRPQLNWSHFKPKYASKPDEDVEAHLLMDTHKFPDQVKVQRFCLTLVGEARLWYKSLRPISTDWIGLQNMFRQQYSKIGNIREQLFHMWRSFHFDKNAETIDAYVN